jgi:glutamyl/glutaminyl-tRNA synthetase
MFVDGMTPDSLQSEVCDSYTNLDHALNFVVGIRRRGLTVEALRQFMLSQGPSQAIVSLEWDSIWAINKKIVDPIAPRHWSILEEDPLVHLLLMWR